MLPVAGQPMIARVLEMLSHGGVGRFVVVVHPDDAPLIELLGGSEWASRVDLAYQVRREGMAAALQCAVPFIQASGDGEFLLAACDNLYPEGHVSALMAYRRFHALDAALTFLQVSREQIPTLAVVAMDGQLVTSIVEKPRPEDAPSDLGVPSLYALSNRILRHLPHVPVSSRGEREFPDVLRLAIEAGDRVGGLTVSQRMTLTRPADLLALNIDRLRADSAAVGIDIAFPEDVVIHHPVRVESGAEIGRGCQLGPDVYVETGGRIGPGARVRRTVILRGAAIPAGASVEDTVVSGTG